MPVNVMDDRSYAEHLIPDGYILKGDFESLKCEETGEEMELPDHEITEEDLEAFPDMGAVGENYSLLRMLEHARSRYERINTWVNSREEIEGKPREEVSFMDVMKALDSDFGTQPIMMLQDTDQIDFPYAAGKTFGERDRTGNGYKPYFRIYNTDQGEHTSEGKIQVTGVSVNLEEMR